MIPLNSMKNATLSLLYGAVSFAFILGMLWLIGAATSPILNISTMPVGSLLWHLEHVYNGFTAVVAPVLFIGCAGVILGFLMLLGGSARRLFLAQRPQ